MRTYLPDGLLLMQKSKTIKKNLKIKTISLLSRDFIDFPVDDDSVAPAT